MLDRETLCRQAVPLSWLLGTSVVVFIASPVDMQADVWIIDVLVCASDGWSMSSMGLEHVSSFHPVCMLTFSQFPSSGFRMVHMVLTCPHHGGRYH